MSCVILKPGKEKSVLRRHPWVFSGAIATFPPCSNGEILPLYSTSKALLGTGYFHTGNSIAGRMLSFGSETAHEAMTHYFKESLRLREKLLTTNAYRLINAEGDGLPGLIVDRYDQVVVIQVNTTGMEKLKPFVIESLVNFVNPTSIYEKSISMTRRQ